MAKYTEQELRMKILEGTRVVHLPDNPKACQKVTLLENSIRLDYYSVTGLYDKFAKPIASYTCSLDSYGKEWEFFDDKTSKKETDKKHYKFDSTIDSQKTINDLDNKRLNIY